MKDIVEVSLGDFVGFVALSKGVCLIKMIEDGCEESRKSTQKITQKGFR